jgi:hypothetical protein
MTRRETFRLLGAVPLLGIPLAGLRKSESTTVALQWDWNPSTGDTIDHFEVIVTGGDDDDVAADRGNRIVKRVGGDLRSCEISLPADGARYRARVRAVNAHGTSDHSAPTIFRA